MEFIVREMSNKPGTVYVRYDCACGCKPGVEYTRDSSDVEHEQCCCGNVHFVGPDARQHLEEHIVSRQDEDADLGGYNVSDTQVSTPWGGSVAVAYALPNKPRAH